jgi:predicted nuclease of predicted toxin-antitoxin system
VKLLLDTCVWGGIRAGLISAGHDVVWAGEWKEDPGDDEFWHALIVMAGQGFRRTGSYARPASRGIVRLVTWSSQQKAVICTLVLDRYGAELQAGAIV